MKARYKLAAAALIAASLCVLGSEPADAHVDVSISVGVPGVAVGGAAFVGDYDFYRPCSWYHYWNIPGPARCYRDFLGFYGPNLYIVDGFVFRDHEDFERWHDRDDWEHWRVHDFRRADWHDNGLHRGWYKHHRDEDADDDDRGRGRHDEDADDDRGRGHHDEDADEDHGWGDHDDHGRHHD